MSNNSNKTIAKNTIVLYFRMIVTMLISLYTSRVVLQVLGVEDFGIYHSVGGVVGMFAFVNGALATGSSRFLTAELGTGNFEKLKRTFSTVLTVHATLAILFALVLETVGMWFLNNKLIIPAERMDAAKFLLHLSALSSLLSITQVPYSASIVSHEKMGIYAYTTITDAVLKLLIVYALTIAPFDKLKFYAFLGFVVNIGMLLFYRFYCLRHFPESHYQFVADKKIMKSIFGFSGWGILGSIARMLQMQGSTVLINMFFSPSVVAARAVANQVNSASLQFINNFRTAVNPQIIKRYAANEKESSKKLQLETAKLAYYIMLVLAFPICLVARPLLQLWLGQVPEHSVAFLQVTIATSLIDVFDISFLSALWAKGRIKENALVSPFVLFAAFPIAYVMFRCGMPPVSICWAFLVSIAVMGFIVKPLLIIKYVDYTWSEIIPVFLTCGKVTLAALPIPLFFYFWLNPTLGSDWLRFLVFVPISVCFVVMSIWLIGLDKKMRNAVISFVKTTFHKKNKS